MLDDLLAGDAAEAILYTVWLEEQIAAGIEGVGGVLRFDPTPRPWRPEWITLAA